MQTLAILGRNLRNARKKKFPKDDMLAFAQRIGISRATLQKMEQGDLSVSICKYYTAAEVTQLTDAFNDLFTVEESMFDD